MLMDNLFDLPSDMRCFQNLKTAMSQTDVQNLSVITGGCIVKKAVDHTAAGLQLFNQGWQQFCRKEVGQILHLNLKQIQSCLPQNLRLTIPDLPGSDVLFTFDLSIDMLGLFVCRQCQNLRTVKQREKRLL